jgi:hypothetical protein
LNTSNQTRKSGVATTRLGRSNRAAAWRWAAHLFELVDHTLGQRILGTHHDKVDLVLLDPVDDLRIEVITVKGWMWRRRNAMPHMESPYAASIGATRQIGPWVTVSRSCSSFVLIAIALPLLCKRQRAERGHLGDVCDTNAGDAGGNIGYARVARQAVELPEHGRLGKLPAEGVLCIASGGEESDGEYVSNGRSARPDASCMSEVAGSLAA